MVINRRWVSGRELGLQACAGGLYFAAGKLGFSLAFAHSFSTPVGPAAGLALGLLLIAGYSLWPGLLVGAFLLNLSTFSSRGLGWPTVAAASMCVSSGNVIGAMAGAWLVETYAKGRDAFRQPRTVVMFVTLGAVASTALSAASGVVIYSVSHIISWHKADELWFSWWLSDMVGVVLFTPLLVIWSSEKRPRPDNQQWAEAAALIGLLLLSCWITFGGWFVVGNRMTASSFFVIPIVLWTAFRFGQRGTTIVTFIVCCVATLGTIRGHGPFAVPNHDTSLLLLQDFIGVIAIMSLLLAADVSQRRRSDAGLRASEQRYRELFENNPQPCWVFDYESLRFLAVNPAATQHYGYSREEFLTITLEDLWPAEDRLAMKEMLSRARSGGEPRARCRHRKKDGTLIHVDVARNNLFFDSHPAGIALVMDVTERTRAEQQATAFSELGRSLSAASSPQQAAQEILRTAASLLGCDGGSIELCPANSNPWQTLCHFETSGEGKQVVMAGGTALPQELLKRVVQRGPELTSLAPAQAASNGSLTQSLSQLMVPVRQEDRVIGVLWLRNHLPNAYDQQDLRIAEALAHHCAGALDRMRAETALRESDDRLKLALAASRMGVWTIELKDRRKIVSSPELDAIFGLHPGEFDGSEEALFKQIHPEDRELARKAMARAVKIEGDYEVEFRILPRNRPIAWLLVRGRAYLDSRGEPVQLGGVAIDITAHKQAQQEILRLNTDLERRVGERTSQLEAINRELEAFSYSVSHDLRAPLRSVRGFCQVLLDRYSDQLDARGCEFLLRAAESSRHMDSLIEDLLQLSRISRADLHPRTVDLSTLAQNIANELHQAEPKRKVDFAIMPELRATGEEQLLRLVLENLLRNAWKFTAHEPKARIEFGHLDGPPSAFFVRDNGAGFDMKYADRLFGAFQRLHSSSEFPGTGVGLATVQRILNRHGGRAWAEGAPMKGATFYFSLPSNEGI